VRCLNDARTDVTRFEDPGAFPFELQFAEQNLSTGQKSGPGSEPRTCSQFSPWPVRSAVPGQLIFEHPVPQTMRV
jgi:hypothetical protein